MRIKQLENLASSMVGDGEFPNIFFVTIGNNVALISVDFNIAYEFWYEHSQLRDKETTLEDRQWGTICTVEPESDNSKKLITIDDSRKFKKRFSISELDHDLLNR